jgi:hypothetical protein
MYISYKKETITRVEVYFTHPPTEFIEEIVFYKDDKVIVSTNPQGKKQGCKNVF